MKTALASIFYILLPVSYAAASGPSGADLTQGIALLLFIVLCFVYSLVCLVFATVSKRKRTALHTINAAISGLLTCAIIFLTVRTDFTEFGVTHSALLVMLVPMVSFISSIAHLRRRARTAEKNVHHNNN